MGILKTLALLTALRGGVNHVFVLKVILVSFWCCIFMYENHSVSSNFIITSYQYRLSIHRLGIFKTNNLAPSRQY